MSIWESLLFPKLNVENFLGISLLGVSFIEILLLFLFSRTLTQSISKLILRIVKSRKATVSIMAMLFLPGTALHEVAHLLTASVMLVPVGEIDILPKFDGEKVLLGTVEVGETDFLRRAIIGMAPLLWGTGVIIFLSWMAFGPLFDTLPTWIMAVFFYAVFSIGNTMFSSKKDMEGMVVFAAVLTFLLLIALLAFYLIGYWPTFLIDFLKKPEFLAFFQKTVLFLSIPVLLDLALLMLAKLFLQLKSA